MVMETNKSQCQCRDDRQQGRGGTKREEMKGLQSLDEGEEPEPFQNNVHCGPVQTGHLGCGVGQATKGLLRLVGGISDLPFGMLLLILAPCNWINRQLSASPDPLWRVRESEIIFFTLLLYPIFGAIPFSPFSVPASLPFFSLHFLSPSPSESAATMAAGS